MGPDAADPGHTQPPPARDGQRRRPPADQYPDEKSGSGGGTALGMDARKRVFEMVKAARVAIACVVWGGSLAGSAAFQGSQPAKEKGRPPAALFRTGDSCLACHNGLTTATGEDVSIGS